MWKSYSRTKELVRIRRKRLKTDGLEEGCQIVYRLSHYTNKLPHKTSTQKTLRHNSGDDASNTLRNVFIFRIYQQSRCIMLRKSYFILIFSMFFCLGLLFCLSHNNAQDMASKPEFAEQASYKMKLEVRILQIDQKNVQSLVEIYVRLGPLPHQFNETAILIQILGGGDVMVPCNKTASDSFGVYYSGNASAPWYLIGWGELFPFDYYAINFKASALTNINFSLTEATAIFWGLNQKSLMDTWKTKDSINTIPVHISEGKTEFLAIIRRRWIAPFLELVLPIVFCYWFLGSSMFFDPKSRINERLMVYLSLFVFAPTFFVAIFPFIPYRSFLSIPEFLLVNLVTSIVFFGIFTMVHAHSESFSIRNMKFPWDFLGILSALLLFLLLYLSLVFSILMLSPSIGNVVTLFFVIFGYVIGIIGLMLRLKREEAVQKEKREKVEQKSTGETNSEKLRRCFKKRVFIRLGADKLTKSLSYSVKPTHARKKTCSSLGFRLEHMKTTKI